MSIEQLKDFSDIGIIIILGLMSLISLSYIFERFMFYRSIDISEYENYKELEIELSNHLSIIATIASNAPYVGLLGTVGGIMITFYTLGSSGITDPKEIMQGLALALKATAMGLVVAIPSQIFYNLLARRADVIATRWEIENDKQI